MVLSAVPLLVSDAQRMRVGVIGARGFIGGHVLRAVTDAGGSAVALVDTPSPELPGAAICVAPRAAPVRELARHLRGLDGVVIASGHAVPAAFQAEPLARYSREVQELTHWALALAEARVQRCVYLASGGTVYGANAGNAAREIDLVAPVNTYGAAKLSCESVLRSFASVGTFAVTVLRVANAYGPGQRARRGQGVVATFIDSMLRGETVEVWGDGSEVRDFVHARDVAASVIAALRHDDAPASTYNIGSGIPTRIGDLLDALRRELPLARPPRYRARAKGTAHSNVLDISRAATCLGWRPTISLPAGLRDTIDWHRLHDASPEQGWVNTPRP